MMAGANAWCRKRSAVLIGAGFDSFCLRRPAFAEHVEIYEINHRLGPGNGHGEMMFTARATYTPMAMARWEFRTFAA
jgi:hypothetical protein